MQWTLRGAHLLLQTRTKILNNELEEVFRLMVPAVPRSSRLTHDFLTHSYPVRSGTKFARKGRH